MSKDVLVLGGGLAGLSAAHHLGGVPVFEREPAIGGHARTHEEGGFLFDEGAHVFFGKGECAQRFVWEPLGAELQRQTADIWNHYGGRRFGRYPVQVNLHAVDPEVAVRCLIDFVEAARRPPADAPDYEQWCHATFGRAMAEEFMLRYARKVWTVEPKELTTEWLGSSVGVRIARPSLEQVLRGAVDPKPQVLNYLTEFAYPRQGGFGRLAAPISQGVEVHTGVAVTRVQGRSRTITFSDGTERRYVLAVSTIPLPELVAMSDAPDDVRAAADRLLWTSVRCVNLGIDRTDVGPGHWCYFYGADVPFFRISFPSRLSPGSAPPGTGSISCEIAYSRRRPLDESSLVQRSIAALRGAGILRETDRILFQGEIDVPYAYVVFDHARTAAVERVHEWMRSVGLLPSGRYGEWGYHWSFEALESGRRVAEEVRSQLVAR